MTLPDRYSASRVLLRALARLLARIPSALRLVPTLADRFAMALGPRDLSAPPYIKRRRYSSFQILVYHRVGDERDPFFSRVPIRVFSTQMESLRACFNVLTLQELVERSKRDDVPPKAVAITFDDGYRDNYEHAFPILRGLGLPATIFLATGVTGSAAPLWHDLLFEAVRRTTAPHISIEGHAFPLETIAEKRLMLDAIRRILRSLDPHGRDAVIRRLIDQLGLTGEVRPYGEYLSWRQIKEMAGAGITFGAHTVTHPILTRLPLTQAMDEILGSRDTIQRHLGCPVTLFAYPNGGRGDFDDSIKALLRAAGFRAAVTNIWGNNDSRTDPLELRRIRVWDSDPELFPLKLSWYKLTEGQ